jgi:hypothetical protein
MRRLVVIGILAFFLKAVGVPTADACYCGAMQHCCHRVQSCDSCCTVMKTCQGVVYEEKQCTFYKTVYEEVKEKVVVPVVKYVEETEYRDTKCTIWQPKETGACEPVKSCAPAACASPTVSTEMTPVECIRKTPHTVYRCVCEQKTVERPRVVVKQVPYTVTCRVPKVVCKQVPVEVCAPAPQCCVPASAGY